MHLGYRTINIILLMLFVVIIVTIFSLVSSRPILADRDLDALTSKAFTDRSTLNYTWKFFRTEHRELIAEYGG